MGGKEKKSVKVYFTPPKALKYKGMREYTLPKKSVLKVYKKCIVY